MTYLILVLLFAATALFMLGIHWGLSLGVVVIGIFVIGYLIRRKNATTTPATTTTTTPKKKPEFHWSLYIFSLIIIGLLAWVIVGGAPYAASCASGCISGCNKSWKDFNIASTQARPENTVSKPVWWAGPVNPGMIVEIGEITYNSTPRMNNCIAIYINYSAVQCRLLDPTTEGTSKWEEVSMDNNGQEFCASPVTSGILQLTVPPGGVQEYVTILHYKSRQ
ncbi:hypothetical protein COT97_02205 [Candidatus Falkowbacteria bacterium CG10_big_fil_rev_8_21_14_0_10_39_11]|uniref:Uncharacterized protein n=1 Tax=Candidatus Falkowbacteria bacterium CG10_big_fil_rev_8_21_14_0_10_39_11 TaxID=1974565 RepID=A0A2H0V5E2_9BACT|nr:MAG: hypothetical protein COT97_02205 [Candidatus Falkowbacteria bacterium CG10_big_fil_rev_8_21_14_0_10_39_11]